MDIDKIQAGQRTKLERERQSRSLSLESEENVQDPFIAFFKSLETPKTGDTAYRAHDRHQICTDDLYQSKEDIGLE